MGAPFSSTSRPMRHTGSRLSPRPRPALDVGEQRVPSPARVRTLRCTACLGGLEFMGGQ